MYDQVWLGIFCGTASITAIFLSIYFFFNRRNGAAEIFLGLIFLAISLRVVKSLLYFGFAINTKISVGIGFVSIVIIGASFLSYILISKNGYVKRIQLLHWVIPIFTIVLAFIEPISFRFLYKYATWMFSIYLIIAGLIHFLIKNQSGGIKALNAKFWIGLVIINASFFLQNASDNITFYSYGAVLASVAVYFLFYHLLLKVNFPLFNSQTDVSESVLMTIQKAIEEDKIYLIPTLGCQNFQTTIKSLLI